MSATIDAPAMSIDEQIAALQAERETQSGPTRSALTRKINRLEKQRAETARAELRDLTAEEFEPAIAAMTDDEVVAELARQRAEAETEIGTPEDVAAARADVDPEKPVAADYLVPHVREALDANGEKFDELDAEQKQRAHQAPHLKGGLRGKALVAWILGGKAGVDAQAQEGRTRAAAERKTTSKPRTRKGATGANEEDIAAATMASEIAGEKGKGLSQRITPAEALRTRAAMAALIAERVSAGHFPNAGANPETDPNIFPAALGFTSERAFRAYVNGTDKALKDDARAGVKDLTRRIASHQVWARKAAAAAFGVMRQLQA